MLANVRESIRLARPRLLSSLRDLNLYLGRSPTIEESLDYFDTTLDELLKRGLWSRLLADAGIGEPVEAPDESQLSKGLCRLSHINCPEQIKQVVDYLSASEITVSKQSPALIEMLHTTLWGTQFSKFPLDVAKERLRANPTAIKVLFVILDYRLKQSPSLVSHGSGVYAPLVLHAAYTRDEILVGLGHWSFNNRPRQCQGVLHLKERKLDVFFVTLQKS